MTTDPSNQLRNSLSGVKVVLEQVRENFELEEYTLYYINNAIDQVEEAITRIDKQIEQQIDSATLELLAYYEEKRRTNPNFLQQFLNFLNRD
jgi:hypothetical protein